jgi:hypothetical protein
MEESLEPVGNLLRTFLSILISLFFFYICIRIVLLFSVMCVIYLLCLIVNHCHRVKTHLQLMNITLHYIFALYSLCVVCPLLCSFMYCVLFERGVLFCVMCVICVLCLIVVPLPPGKDPFIVKIIIIINIDCSDCLMCISRLQHWDACMSQGPHNNIVPLADKKKFA